MAYSSRRTARRRPVRSRRRTSPQRSYRGRVSSNPRRSRGRTTSRGRSGQQRIVIEFRDPSAPTPAADLMQEYGMKQRAPRRARF